MTENGSRAARALCRGGVSRREARVLGGPHDVGQVQREGDVWTVLGETEAGCSASLGAPWHHRWGVNFGAVTKARSQWQNYIGCVLGLSRLN